jgi:hypothetical protein
MLGLSYFTLIPQLIVYFVPQIINNEEKAIIAIGDGWEWNVPKRLLSSITELYLVHMKRDTIVAKLAGNSAYLSSLMNLKKIYFLNNDFTSLKQVSHRHRYRAPYDSKQSVLCYLSFIVGVRPSQLRVLPGAPCHSRMPNRSIRASRRAGTDDQSPS